MIDSMLAMVTVLPTPVRTSVSVPLPRSTTLPLRNELVAVTRSVPDEPMMVSMLLTASVLPAVASRTRVSVPLPRSTELPLANAVRPPPSACPAAASTLRRNRGRWVHRRASAPAA
jgi:hypothetical protein